VAGPCRLVRAGRAVDARWRRDGDTLVVSPAAEPPLALPLAEVSGVAGDGFSIVLRTPGAEVALERLGADGPTLLEELRRDWPVLRAAVLRLAGGERPGQVFSGQVAAPAARGAFRGFFVDERLLLAPDGGDVQALFAADAAAVGFDESSYSVRLDGWDGTRVLFGKLGGATTAFSAALAAARARLASQADTALAAHLPSIGAAARANLAARWLPGRLLGLGELEGLCPGFGAAVAASWLAGCPRAAAGARFIAEADPARRFLGYFVAPGGGEPLLWLLVGTAEAWSLELLSEGDWATYLFRGGDEVPRLVESVVRLPDFSREALYLPLDQLVGERSTYAVPARDFAPLRDLRAHFSGRKIHAPS
jgi:hypothetical protein